MSKDHSNKNSLSDFASRASTVWSTDKLVTSGLGGRANYRSSRNSSVASTIAAAGNDPVKLREISQSLRGPGFYSDIVNYYKTMFLYRYTVIPISQEGAKEDSLLEVSSHMLKVVDSIKFSSIIPNMLETGLYEGQVAFTIEREGDIVKTYILPNDYSAPFLMSSYGTYTLLFNLDYFTEIIESVMSTSSPDVITVETNKKREKRKAQRDEQQANTTISVLNLFPKVLRDAYLDYAGLDSKGKKIKKSGKEEKSNLFPMPPETSTIVMFSPNGAPPKLKAAEAEERLSEVLGIDLLKQKSSLEKLLTVSIPLDDQGNPLLTVDEAREIQASMATYFEQNAAKVLVATTFGKSEFHDLQGRVSERQDSINLAINSLYESSSVNPQLFRANTDYALSVSLQRDASFMWDIILRIVDFYSTAVNDEFSFDNYKCSITMLPITQYNEEAKVTEYRRNAEYGIGKLDAIIATGQSQSGLIDKLLLEKTMNLDEMLVPLQSSHTRSKEDTKVTEQEVKKVEGEQTDKEKEVAKNKAENEVEDEQA